MRDGTDEDDSTETTPQVGGREVAADGGPPLAPEESRPATRWSAVPADDDPGRVAVRWADLRRVEHRVEELRREVERRETEVRRARRRRRQTAARYERLAERHEGWNVTAPEPPDRTDDDGIDAGGSEAGPVRRLLSALTRVLERGQ